MVCVQCWQISPPAFFSLFLLIIANIWPHQYHHYHYYRCYTSTLGRIAHCCANICFVFVTVFIFFSFPFSSLPLYSLNRSLVQTHRVTPLSAASPFVGWIPLHIILFVSELFSCWISLVFYPIPRSPALFVLSFRFRPTEFRKKVVRQTKTDSISEQR